MKYACGCWTYCEVDCIAQLESFNELTSGGRVIADWATQTDYVLYPQHYNPPAQVSIEEIIAAAVDPETGVVSVLVGSSKLDEEYGLPSGFVVGFVCGTMSLSFLVGIIALVCHVREAVASGNKTVATESGEADRLS
ncbi:hypothetical protein DYB32_003593 [Aphanomyces invadans]|uniref:Uncharacterized protein n=1 Tax=Aphanomyces invadans TaxID=157072 RepID=A0A418B0A2_9STRA|nr:hypothetical protein DYB32_003593 [Aphanomyces invadans]